jgi:hypothetical protein
MACNCGLYLARVFVDVYIWSDLNLNLYLYSILYSMVRIVFDFNFFYRKSTVGAVLDPTTLTNGIFKGAGDPTALTNGTTALTNTICKGGW